MFQLSDAIIAHCFKVVNIIIITLRICTKTKLINAHIIQMYEYIEYDLFSYEQKKPQYKGLLFCKTEITLSFRKS